jgi:hypothetical protein
MGKFLLSSDHSPPLRKNIINIQESERNILRDAFIALNTNEEVLFSGDRNDKPFPGGVSYWFKQDEIHQATHVHGGPAFLTWHRELCNRFERLLRMADKQLHFIIGIGMITRINFLTNNLWVILMVKLENHGLVLVFTIPIHQMIIIVG